MALEIGERLKFVVNKLGPSPERSQILARLLKQELEHEQEHHH